MVLKYRKRNHSSLFCEFIDLDNGYQFNLSTFKLCTIQFMFSRKVHGKCSQAICDKFAISVYMKFASSARTFGSFPSRRLIDTSK